MSRDVTSNGQSRNGRAEGIVDVVDRIAAEGTTDGALPILFDTRL
jgi:hypothetical protein